ncbi:hypothetical protein [Treponema parvum]|uniref:hypothetical protein n=1 Tax=Treponema parvum TaxID=138851 RepID=UPI001AEBA805|nr:hypothetical protein [Treponema parvum]QTQ17179.1 hypothetical protein HXT04_11025 [Treponema parvum]
MIKTNGSYKADIEKMYQVPTYMNPAETEALYKSQYDALMKIQDQIKAAKK